MIDKYDKSGYINKCSPTANTRGPRFLKKNRFSLYFQNEKSKSNLKDFNCAQCACLNTVDIPKEKRTDINIASQLFLDFYYDNCDTARIISGDSDLVPAIKVTKSIFQNKKIKFYFPPKRFSGEIKKVCDSSKMLPVNILDNCLLPDQLMNKFGYVIKRPVKWY
jgi:uncharacterized LabA/DUF88 family protein